jgi:hypothetical protein
MMSFKLSGTGRNADSATVSGRDVADAFPNASSKTILHSLSDYGQSGRANQCFSLAALVNDAPIVASN